MIQQLDFFGAKRGRQRHDGGVPGIVDSYRLRHGLRERDPVQQRGQVLQRDFERQTALRHAVGDGNQCRAILLLQRLQDIAQIVLIDAAQHGTHRLLLDFAAAVRNRLVEQGEAVAHAAMRGSRQQCQSFFFAGHFFQSENFFELLADLPLRDLLQVELQATRQHGDRDFLRVGGGEDEFDVARRLFERFQHCVERAARKHVHFVDDVDLETCAGRRVQRVLEQVAHVVDLGIGRGVELYQVDKTSGVDCSAGAAFAAGCRRNAGFAVERLGDDARQRRFADAARAGKQVGVMQALLRERVGQRSHDVLLADQFSKGLGAPLAGENLAHLLETVSAGETNGRSRIHDRRPTPLGIRNGIAGAVREN